jgi:two-component system heavy metal sensor histidine kinase CusS
MSASLRIRYFRWLVFQTLVVFAAVVVAVTVFNLIEMQEHADMIEEETEETLTVLGLQLLLVPFAIGSAWIITGRLLAPLKEIVEPAERICAGKLSERINTQHPDDEVGRLARTLNAAFDRYDSALTRLERFSFDAAHQLRNPLAAIRATGEVCLEKERSDEEYRSTIGKMLEETRRLGHTVNQLLMLARLGHEDLRKQFTTVSLTSLVKTLAEEANMVCETKEIEFTLDAPSDVNVTGSEPLLREAVANLLDNAMRFTPAGGSVMLKLAPAKNGLITLSVQDTGPGISFDQKSRLFQPFQRTQTALPDGTGLGLAIVSEIVHLHGGSVELHTPSNGGSRFEVILPSSA